ncbi:Panacea domain-containing protein [Jeotgalibacillus marinus]|uniref:Type II toxin-antitoxin system antitoxin SocA domain-containing protein n=1 Tax=Jeotgalibacillus marinus TaxID=86667 RepID=A0ABV3Q3H0_9BACL
MSYPSDNQTVFSSIDISHYFFKLRDQSYDNVSISNLKLQKLLYYAHGLHLAVTEYPLLNEQLEAWKLGPVSPSSYRNFNYNGSLNIKVIEHFDESILSDVAKQVTEAVWEQLGGKSARYLMTKTHAEKPWKESKLGEKIDDGIMKDFFKSQFLKNTK